ncbi:MAG: flagellar hook-length control protein FliK [Pseudomonadota bacterium]
MNPTGYNFYQSKQSVSYYSEAGANAHSSQHAKKSNGETPGANVATSDNQESSFLALLSASHSYFRFGGQHTSRNANFNANGLISQKSIIDFDQQIRLRQSENYNHRPDTQNAQSQQQAPTRYDQSDLKDHHRPYDRQSTEPNPVERNDAPAPAPKPDVVRHDNAQDTRHDTRATRDSNGQDQLSPREQSPNHENSAKETQQSEPSSDTKPKNDGDQVGQDKPQQSQQNNDQGDGKKLDGKNDHAYQPFDPKTLSGDKKLNDALNPAEQKISDKTDDDHQNHVAVRGVEQNNVASTFENGDKNDKIKGDQQQHDDPLTTLDQEVEGERIIDQHDVKSDISDENALSQAQHGAGQARSNDRAGQETGQDFLALQFAIYGSNLLSTNKATRNHKDQDALLKTDDKQTQSNISTKIDQNAQSLQKQVRFDVEQLNEIDQSAGSELLQEQGQLKDHARAKPENWQLSLTRERIEGFSTQYLDARTAFQIQRQSAVSAKGERALAQLKDQGASAQNDEQGLATAHLTRIKATNPQAQASIRAGFIGELAKADSSQQQALAANQRANANADQAQSARAGQINPSALNTLSAQANSGFSGSGGEQLGQFDQSSLSQRHVFEGDKSDQAQKNQHTSGAERNATSKFVHQQISVQIKQAVANGLDRINIQLRPEHLGKVDVRLTLNAASQLSAVIVSERADTLELLKNDQKSLIEALKEAGFSTDAGSLEFSLNHQQSGGSDRTSDHADDKFASKNDKNEKAGEEFALSESSDAIEAIETITQGNVSFDDDGHLDALI